MESQQINLTKAQVAGIVAGELKRNYVWLQCFLLASIGLIVVNLFAGGLTPLITLFIGVVQLVIIYFMYNSNRNKVSEFKEKYGVN